MDTPLLSEETKATVANTTAQAAAFTASALVDGINTAANYFVHASNAAACAIVSLTPAAYAVGKTAAGFGESVLALVPDQKPKTPFAVSYTADGTVTLHVHGLPLRIEDFELITPGTCDEAKTAFDEAEALTWENISGAEAAEAQERVKHERTPDFILAMREQSVAACD